jgi:glycosyltransferase involved in cell wall biosynthesis
MSSGRRDIVFYLPEVGPLLADAGGRATGGAETQVFLLAQALARRGTKVAIVTLDPGKGLPAVVDGIEIVPAVPYDDERRFAKLALIASVWRGLAPASSRVIVARSAGVHVGVVAFLSRLWRRRFVYSSASPWDFDFKKYNRRALDGAIYRLGVRLADHIVVQTDEQAELCSARYRRPATVIRSIAVPDDAGARSESRRSFLWVGRAVWYKGPLAYVALARSLPHAHFRMVVVPGSDEEGTALQEQLDRAAAELPNLELLPPRPRNELLRLYDDSVAVVNTSDCEGMSNVFLEAWARGIPTLALSQDPDGIVERYSLGYVAHDSPQRLTDAARELWGQRRDLGNWVDRCQAYVRDHHSADAVAARWVTALQLPDRSREDRPAAVSLA